MYADKLDTLIRTMNRRMSHREEYEEDYEGLVSYTNGGLNRIMVRDKRSWIEPMMNISEAENFWSTFVEKR